MLILKVFCLLFTLSLTACQTFQPGCSFYNGQCVYNVKLGHEAQCDTARSVSGTTSSTTTSGGLQSCSCKDIDTINSNVNSLVSNMNTLQSNFDKLAIELNTTQEQLGMKESELAALSLDKQSMNAQFTNRQMLMDKSQVDLANTVSTLNIEVDRLRHELTATNDQLVACETTVGLSSGKSPNPVLYGGYVVHYCGFEDHRYCNYTMDSCTSSREECWHRGSGRQNTNSGPVEDHTFGAPNGHYMYIDPTLKPTYKSSSSSHVPTRKARMTSPELPPANEYCLRFWYTMYGDDVGRFNVYAQVGGGDGYPIYTKSSQDNNQWHMVQLSIDSEYTATPFKIVFEATTDSFYTYSSSSHHNAQNVDGYISFDDVYLYNTSCSSIPVCPAGFHKRTSGNVTYCYTFHVTPMSWYDAVKVCKTESPNGHLISVESKVEQDFIVNIVQNDASYTTVGSQGWYTSGNDERSEGNYKWTNTGFPYSLNYTDWHIGQPNNVGDVQDCLLMQYKDAGYEWGDVNCGDKHPFICEMHM